MGLPEIASLRADCHVFIDFDGTIATIDTTDALLERFGEPEWRAIEDDWKAGRIGSRECMVRQIALVRATPGELDAFIAGIEIDPGFADFIDFCQQHGIGMTVVSDGLDRTVAAVLARHDIEIPIRANRMRWVGGNRWVLDFPHAQSDCRALSGNCKCQFANQRRSMTRIMIGDGRSDFCVAERVDFVLAKASLLKHAVALDLPHAAYADFHAATRLLAQWLADQAQFPETIDTSSLQDRAR